MRKLNLAIIGQGRSGRNIHGRFYLSNGNVYFNVKYVIDADPIRRKDAKCTYPDCQTLSDYTELFDKKDIDLVVNTTPSQFHYSITKELLSHGFNVLTEKPFTRNKFECDELFILAEQKGLIVTAFQQTFCAPFYQDAIRIIKDKIVGDTIQVSVRYNHFGRRWDWQTLVKKMAGCAFNTGPHPISIGLGALDFDDNAKIAFSCLKNTPLCSGDADDFCKIIITAPNKPIIDIEISSADAYNDYTIKIQGTKGTFKCSHEKWEMIYIKDEDNAVHEVVENTLTNANNIPAYCSEQLVKYEEKGEYDGDEITTGTREFYKNLYFALTESKPMFPTRKMITQTVNIIEQLYATNPLERKF